MGQLLHPLVVRFHMCKLSKRRTLTELGYFETKGKNLHSLNKNAHCGYSVAIGLLWWQSWLALWGCPVPHLACTPAMVFHSPLPTSAPSWLETGAEPTVSSALQVPRCPRWLLSHLNMFSVDFFTPQFFLIHPSCHGSSLYHLLEMSAFLLRSVSSDHQVTGTWEADTVGRFIPWPLANTKNSIV